MKIFSTPPTAPEVEPEEESEPKPDKPRDSQNSTSSSDFSLLDDDELLGGGQNGQIDQNGVRRVPLVGANDLCAVIRVLKLEEAIDSDALQIMIFELVKTISDSILLHSLSSTYSR